MVFTASAADVPMHSHMLAIVDSVNENLLLVKIVLD